MKKLLNIEKYTIPQMLLLIAFLILVFPLLLTIPAISNLMDFSDKGQIGDTIGGITAPFINGLAAILVFLAFKEQIRANEIFKKQEKAKMILDQIALIQEDKLQIETVIRNTINRKGIFTNEFSASEANYLNKIIFFITEFKLAIELLNEYEDEKVFIYKKLYYLYAVRFKDLLDELDSEFNPPFYYHTNYSNYFSDIQMGRTSLNEYFHDVNKFKIEN